VPNLPLLFKLFLSKISGSSKLQSLQRWLTGEASENREENLEILD
jgi:hypothetical protein